MRIALPEMHRDDNTTLGNRIGRDRLSLRRFGLVGETRFLRSVQGNRRLWTDNGHHAYETNRGSKADHTPRASVCSNKRASGPMLGSGENVELHSAGGRRDDGYAVHGIRPALQ